MARILSPANLALPTTFPFTPEISPLIGGYPDVRRPEGRAMKLNVELSTDSPAPARVLVKLVQDQSSIGKGIVTIQSKVFTVDNVPRDYQMDILNPSKIAFGRCNLSLLEIHVSAAPCCEDLPMPDVLQYSLSNHAGSPPDCSCITSSGTLNRVGSTNVWQNLSITTGDCGQTLGIKVWCDSNLWYVQLSGCATLETPGGPIDCDAFEIELIQLNSQVANCCDQLNSATSFKIVITT